VVDLIRRWVERGERPPQSPEPLLSFGAWDALSVDETVVQVCHPRWRGVRTVAYGFRTPVVECDDLERWGGELVGRMVGANLDVVVIQGWPPGAGGFARALGDRGITVKCVLHSSPAQHGDFAGDADIADEVLGLASEGVLAGVGMAKIGVHEAFAAVGHRISYVPNRVPEMPEIDRRDLGDGFHVGVFAEPFWRKNVTTQLLAAAMLDGSVSHVLRRPGNRYLDSLRIVEHGELPWVEFVSLQGSVDLNLYVTLSECHPSTPQESYLAGVPCLISRMSGVFKSDPRLWELTSVDEPDNPTAIAEGARRLFDNRNEAVERAMAWMSEADAMAVERWNDFVSR